MKYFARLFLVVSALALAACGSVKVEDYAGNRPELVPSEFFAGKLTAHGVIKNRAGKVIRSFNATIDAGWQDGVGTLDERFIFDDGERQTRVWTLTPTAKGHYDATAGDVIGTGKAVASGNALFLDYVLRIPYDGDTLDVKIDDRMYLLNDTTLINESIMYKFGVRVGAIALVILKQPG